MKRIITIICALGVTLCMTACGAENKTTDAGQTNQNVETSASAEDVSQTEDPVKDETSETTVVTEPAPAEETTDVETEVEEVAEITEPEKEFVDWETWATQADNDEICLVVWNDVTRKNDIVTKYTAESQVPYILEEGDRVAFPNRIVIEDYSINNKDQSYDYKKPYTEIVNEYNEKGVCVIAIHTKNDEGNRIISARYVLKKTE